jgi:hypothetical protein
MLEVHEQYNMGLKAANDSGNLRPICEKSMNYQIVTETTDLYHLLRYMVMHHLRLQL